jgi:hypothetical protein
LCGRIVPGLEGIRGRGLKKRFSHKMPNDLVMASAVLRPAAMRTRVEGRLLQTGSITHDCDGRTGGIRSRSP